MKSGIQLDPTMDPTYFLGPFYSRMIYKFRKGKDKAIYSLYWITKLMKLPNGNFILDSRQIPFTYPNDFKFKMCFSSMLNAFET